VQSYVNGIPTTSGGAHENGIKSGVAKAVRNYLTTHNLVPRGLQISAEDTFSDDLLLDELAPHIERLAEKTWASYQRELEQTPGRLARTVVLKLKTSDFQILTRSLTPSERPTSLAALIEVACALRERVALPSRTRYRLVGVGLSGFIDPHAFDPQAELFAAAHS